MSNSTRRIVDRHQLHFANNEELRVYYEAKYQEGGYEGGGYVVHGVDVSAMYHAARMESALRLLAPASHELLLDAGCGTGALAAQLATRSRETHAVDIAANALDRQFASIPNLHFRPMNLEKLDFPDAHFDGITCVETLEHLLSPQQAMAELARVLKPGGRLVVTYPTINRTLAKRWHLARYMPVSEHLTEWSCRELTAVMRSSGLEPGTIEGIAFDFGIFSALKHINRFFASSITRCSLAIRRFPANSNFVALLARKT